MTLLASDPALWDVVFQESPQRARFVQRLLGRKGARVLDVGCATGSLCALLSRRGARVTGVDINAKMIEAAGAKDPAGRYLVGDMRTLSLDQRFDVALCLGTTLSYGVTNDEVAATLLGIGRHLKRGGILMVDVLNAIAFTGPRPFRKRTRHSFSVRGERVTASIEHRLELKQQAMTEQVTWAGRGWKRRDAAETLRLFFPQELTLLLTTTGFDLETLTDQYGRASREFDGRRLIAVARRR